MKPEAKFKRDFLKRMHGRWATQLVEDEHSRNVPDIAYADGCRCGWIEAKYMTRPRNADSIWKIPHLTDGQIEFLHRWWKFGAPTWLLIGVGEKKDGIAETLILLPGNRVQDTVGRSYRQHMERSALNISMNFAPSSVLNVLRYARTPGKLAW